jgi:hypothetical protein
MQQDLHREGYCVFVKCPDITPDVTAEIMVDIVDTLDAVLLEHVGDAMDLYPNPFGGAVYCQAIDQALAVARSVIRRMADAGYYVAVGTTWGRFQRTANVQGWNAAAPALNEAARLAFSKEAVSRVLASPYVRRQAGSITQFTEERLCTVKKRNYQYHALVAAEYVQTVARRERTAVTAAPERTIVLWDIVQ